MRENVVDYEVVGSWGGSSRRFVCRPPGRLGREGEVLVSVLTVDAEERQQLCDQLVRVARAPGGRTVELLEVGPDSETGGAYVVTGSAPGGSLADPVPGGGRGERGVRLEAMEAAARGAHALHEVGLAHGDIHAGTVLFTADGAALDLPRLDAAAGEVVRVDGWAELVAVDPELLRGESPGRSSDIWALGATLHSVLSDRPLFAGIEGDEPVTAVQRIMFTRPEPDPALPSPLLELIGDCLAADPADRPRTALAVAERLAEARA